MNECFLGLSGSKAAKLSASLTLWFDALDLCFCAFVNSPSFSVEQLVILKRQTFGQVWKPLSDLDLFESSCRRRCFSCPIRSSFWSLKHTITTLSLCRFSVISAPLWAVTWRNVIFLTAVQSVRFFFFFLWPKSETIFPIMLLRAELLWQRDILSPPRDSDRKSNRQTTREEEGLIERIRGENSLSWMNEDI